MKDANGKLILKANTEKNFFKRLKVAIYGKKTMSECIVYTVTFIIFSIIALSYVYICFWCFMSGLKLSDDALLKPMDMSTKLYLIHYKEVFSLLQAGKYGFWTMIMNSLIFSIVSQAMTCYFCTSLAYATTKYKFPGSSWFFYISFFMMTIPLYGSGGATYKLYYDLGFINSYSILLLNTAGLGMAYMYYQAMYQSMSNTYFEAADIDGANDWQKFFFIAFPLSMSLMGALFIMGWITCWNSYGGDLIYHPKLPTFACGLYMFQLQMRYGARADILYAACFIAIFPPLILFMLFNKVLLTNVSLGGIKE